MNLSGQKILITGGSRGIGRACAECCATRGAQIVLVARNSDSLEMVRQSLPGTGHIAISADLLHPAEAVSHIFEKACSDGIKLTGLVHAAGIAPVFPIRTTTLSSLQEVFTVNYFSFMLLVRQFIRKNHSNGGSIVAISSVAASSCGGGGMAVYAGSKGALNATIKSLAVELADKGFRANIVSPSFIQTDMMREMTALFPQERLEQQQKRQPLGLGTPQDVAKAVAFLLSPESAFITGTNLTVDGGYTAL